MVLLRLQTRGLRRITFGGVQAEQQNPSWVIDLTSESPVDLIPFIWVLWVPIAAVRDGRHARFFCETLYQLLMKRRGGRM